MTMIGYMPDEISKVIHDFIRPNIRTQVWVKDEKDEKQIKKPYIFKYLKDATEFYNYKSNQVGVSMVELVNDRELWREQIKKFREKVYAHDGTFIKSRKVVIKKSKLSSGRDKYWVKLLHIQKYKNVCSCCNVDLETEFIKSSRAFRIESKKQNIKYKRTDCCEKILCVKCADVYYGGFFCKKEECNIAILDFMDNSSGSDSDSD